MLRVASVSAAVIGVSALIGVYGLALDQVESRQEAYRKAVTAELRARVDSVERVVDRSARVVAASPDDELNRAALAAQYDSGLEYIDQLLVTQDDGRVLSAYPSFQAPWSIASGPVFTEGLAEENRLYHGKGDLPVLWIARSVETDRGTYAVVARVRTQFLSLLVEEFSSEDEGRQVAIFDGDGAMLVAPDASDPISEDSVVFGSLAEDDTGAVTAFSEGDVGLGGRFTSIAGSPGIDWRVAVLEPRSAVMTATWRAITPAVLVLALSGLFTTVVAGLWGRRLVAPLRDLETRAQEAISGAYMHPIETDRADEVGRVADAFNAIALRLNSLHDLSQMLASSSSLDQLLDGIISATGHIVESVSIGVFLVDSSRENLVLARSRGFRLTGDMRLSLSSESPIITALDSSGPESFIGSCDELSELLPPDADCEQVSGLVAPLVVGNEPVGVIVAAQMDVREFSQAEMEMIRSFSAQAAVAVHNSRLFEFEAASRREAETLREVAEQLSASRDLESAFKAVTAIIVTLFNVWGARLAFHDRRSLGMGPAIDPGREAPLLAAWASVHASDASVVVRVDPDTSAAAGRFLVETGASAALLITIGRGENPGAVLALLIDDADRRFSTHELELAEGLATQFSLALENAYHFAKAEVRAENLETVFRISQAVSSSLQTKVVLNRVLDVVQKIFSADAVSLMEYDGTRRVLTTAMARGLLSSDMLRFECPTGQDIPGRVHENGEPLKVDDVSSDSGALAAAAAAQGLHSILAVPLLARGRSIGVLTVFSAETAAFSDEDMGLLLTFASQAALAIDTASMYGREHTVASVLQASILPQNLPDYPELQSSSFYLAAGDEADIGGDYFDLFRAPGGSIIAVIGDVCGKGVAAATKTSMLKYSIRGLVAAGLSPGHVMAEVNNMIAETGETGDIVTLWLGAIDSVGGCLRYANGGHPPGLLRREGTEYVDRLATTGPLLGAITDADYGELEIEIRAGDTLLLYTDGVTEARRGNKFFGEGRVIRSMRHEGTASQVVDRLLNALDRFVPGALRDDAAVLALRFRSQEEPG
jgi:GAF domain-containing protein